MENKVNFSIRKEDDNIIFTQLLEKRMPISESIKELNTLNSEMIQLQHQFQQLESDISGNKLQKQAELISEQIAKLNDIQKQWTELVKDKADDIRKELRTKIKLRKAEMGFNRIKEPDSKIVKMNQIIAPLCEEYHLDITNPLIMELKRDFNTI